METTIGIELGTKETDCTKCAHRNVCKYKDDYLDILSAISNADIVQHHSDGTVSTKKITSFDFVYKPSIICKHCKCDSPISYRGEFQNLSLLG